MSRKSSIPEPDSDAAFRRFVRRVWQDDVAPLLRGRQAAQRKKTASLGGQVAAAGGSFLDRTLGLKGRPFTRALTVMGSSLGAMLPDVWDWKWLRSATPAQRKTVHDHLKTRAAELPEIEALALFGLPPSASHEEFRQAWRVASLRWHPDKAPDEASRSEHTLRFAALCAARDKIEFAYREGTLPAHK